MRPKGWFQYCVVKYLWPGLSRSIQQYQFFEMNGSKFWLTELQMESPEYFV